MIRFIFFDVANTLLHKPALYPLIYDVLKKHHILVDIVQLRKNHKLLSEFTCFPDKTSKNFYSQFNAELLYSLGVIPKFNLLDDIFDASSSLSWQLFDDVTIIDTIALPKGIISNWDITLKEKLKNYFQDDFEVVVGSSECGFSKPHESIYKQAISMTGLAPSEILFVGDSLKLDIEPAEKCGMRAVLIDRDLLFPGFKNRISSMNELKEMID